MRGVIGRSAFLASLFVCAGAVACEPVPRDAPRTLEHTLTRPQNAEGVLLNEDLVFHFSDELDRASVTRDSVRIQSQDGARARGTWTVEHERLRFTPAPVLASDLADGGYQPGTRYTVEIAGFPRLDGLRSASGEPLSRPVRWSFVTTSVDPQQDGIHFVDRQAERQGRLSLFPSVPGLEREHELAPDGSLYLKCDKPLDPSSLAEGTFALVARDGTSVPLRARLLENEAQAALRPRNPRARAVGNDEAWLRERRAALVELTPTRRLDVGAYRLQLSRADGAGTLAGPRDFSRKLVWDPALETRRIGVRAQRGDGGRGLLREDFDGTQLRSTQLVAGVDGTAAWGETGRVELRFPAAAGDGRDGDVLLATEAGADVAAVRLRVARGQACVLPSAAGFVLVRAQGRVSIEGRLTRASGEGPTLAFAPQSLSDWLRQAALDQRNVTVIVAGGDLVIEGELDVSTPLLLVAGGRVRITGKVGAQRDQVHILGEGGGSGVLAEPVRELWIDPPLSNPLREPLRFAVMSGPIPPRGDVLDWIAATAGGSQGGGWRVRYVPEDAQAALDPSARALDTPRLFERPTSLQLLIELELRPGGSWNPPWVDWVELQWTQAATASGAGGR